MEESNEARLVLEKGPISGQTYVLSQVPAVIGRNRAAGILIKDQRVSRRHARIIFENGRYLIEDLDSRNGTFVNGQQISRPLQLDDGDQLEAKSVVTQHLGSFFIVTHGMKHPAGWRDNKAPDKQEGDNQDDQSQVIKEEAILGTV